MTKTKRIVLHVSETFFERASAFLANLKPTTKIVGDRLISLAMVERRRQERQNERKRRAFAARQKEESK